MTEYEFVRYHQGKGVNGMLTAMLMDPSDIPYHRTLEVASFFYVCRDANCWGKYSVTRTFFPRLQKLGVAEDIYGIILHFNKHAQKSTPITYRSYPLRFVKVPLRYYF